MVSPYFRSPFTDLTSGMLTHQWDPRCRDLEMKAVDCMEAYGIDRGLRKCTDLLRDFEECTLRNRQMKRVIAMRRERERQWLFGERSPEDTYAPSPQKDTY